ncbi:XRE family transcriptional regulator [Mesorhizobium australicum]|uniref:Transcriptional regulator, XRE family n=1 Tax=Mesorhizobium australicum TaxID=536018 RepID=A0A1X7MT44_9HYPH|nr:XRE family transcriptional regulator [Mesorhizobium australicum]SMH27982.1 transcriptional regulator, XRE family [Mesorhizobium australicum]
MSAMIESLLDSEIGERLRIAREAVQLTQAVAAEEIDVARTTLVAIERGQRRIKMNELQELCSLYGTSANAILRQEAVHLDMVPRFRKLAQSADDAAERAAGLLNDLVSAELELENALGIKRVRNYPPERPILPGDVRQQAEQDAQDLRDWLGLGAGPVLDIVSLLDLQLGIRVYVRPLDGKISGLFAYDEAVGACMLLNAGHPLGRIIQTGAHELGHFNSARRQPEVLTEGEVPHSREERYADHFGRCFVTPARAVRQRFAEITAGQTHLTRRHIILLASAFGVAREAIVRRLEELGLAKHGTWDWFQANGGITDEQARQVLGELPVRGSSLVEAQGAVPPRLALLAREAWKRGFYSEGQLARLLKLDRHEVRKLLDGAENEESEANELVKLPY